MPERSTFVSSTTRRAATRAATGLPSLLMTTLSWRNRTWRSRFTVPENREVVSDDAHRGAVAC